MGNRRSAVGSLVWVRTAGMVALLAAVGGLFAVSRQLERDLTRKMGPLVLPLVGPAAPPAVIAALPPRRAAAAGVERRHRAVLPTLPRRRTPVVNHPLRVAPSGNQTRPTSPLPPEPAPTPAPPGAEPNPQQPPAPPATALSPPPPAPAMSPKPGRSLTGSGSPQGEAPTTTRPGWGRGDTNHRHTGPPGKPSTPAPPAKSPPQAVPNDAEATQATGGPPPHAIGKAGHDATPSSPPQPTPGALPAGTAADPSPADAAAHGNGSSASAGHKG
jgi:hypothetical protein